MMRMVVRVCSRIVLALLVGSLLGGGTLAAADHKGVKELIAQFKQAENQEKRKEAFLQITKAEPLDPEDLGVLRAVFSDPTYDEALFEAATESLKRVKKPELDVVLIDILKDEKPLLEQAEKKEPLGKSEGELARRSTNIFFVIAKLGEIKSQKAAPILREYLSYKGFKLVASQALAMIGDKSAGERIRTQAYEGEDINFAGQGQDEALKVIRDLQDPSKKAKWPKIAKQIIHIRDHSAKPYLKELLNHEDMDVRWEAAAKLRSMAGADDVLTILEMAKNPDQCIRTEAIFAMQKIQALDFAEELIALLKDPSYLVRLYAAHALGYKRVVQAVPALEEAIKRSEERDAELERCRTCQMDELRVREEAFIALYRLTGKKYDYRGKLPHIEQRAEMEKDHPSFY